MLSEKMQRNIAIKNLLKKGLSPKEICKQLNVSKQVVSYWKKHSIKETHYRKGKVPIEYIKKIVEMAEDQPISKFSSRIIARKMNKIFSIHKIKDKSGKILKICHTTINKLLNKILGKPRKIRKVFYLSEKQMEKRVEFCKMILEKEIKGEDLFITDETQIDLCNYMNDSIRLSKKNQEKLKKGELDVYDLITMPKKKFEKSIMVAGGISSHGLGRLMILNGTENEFCYAQAILNYEEDIKNLKKNLIFEQDGAPSHTSKNNKALLDKIFGKNWIQNPPNSPDLAYPIEDLWAILKNRVKRRNPKNLKELTFFMFEEWYSVPKTLIHNLFYNYIKRVKKIIELNGARLESEHLKEMKEEEKKEKNNEEYGDNHKWKKKDYKVITIYNDEQLLKQKQKEISSLNKVLKNISKVYKKKLITIKNPPKKRIGAISFKKKKNKEINKLKKEDKLKINSLITKLENMSLIEYLKYLNEKKKEKMEEEEEEEEEEEDSTIDESIKKILNLNKIEKKNKDIKYNLAF